MMACRFREELVGKRFLSVSGASKLKLSKISEWGWRAGVIRASSHKDNKHKDLQVLVEYDDMGWQRREWISVHRAHIFQVFMVESALVWCERVDPQDDDGDSTTVYWPALTFVTLVSTMDLASYRLQPVEFLPDRELAFLEPASCVPYKDLETKPERAKECEAVRRWVEAQDGQHMLLTTPTVLKGFRVQVYRAEGTTQWYTAVIKDYNTATREFIVTDDTVLEPRIEDPTLVQIRFIGEGVVESMMRGEDVSTPSRRSRSSITQAHTPPRFQRKVPPIVVDKPSHSRKHLRREAAQPPDRGKEKQGVKKKKPRLKNKDKNDAKGPSKEDLENKKVRKKRRSQEPKKKVLEDAANNSKLLSVVQVRVEDCLRRSSKEEEVSSESSASTAEEEEEEDGEESASVKPTTEDEARMEDGPTAAALRFPDDRSDSGVSSLRGTGSGDERSGSRSSALSGTDEPQVRHVHSVQHQTLLMSHGQQPSPAAPPAAYHPPQAMLHHPLHPLSFGQQQVPEMMWKPSYSHPGAPGPRLHPEDILERDRHERLIRDRREQEAREIEKRREREREKAEREKQEREQAKAEVHKHFEASFKLAQQKQTNTYWDQSKTANLIGSDHARMAEKLRYNISVRGHVAKVDYPPPAHRGVGKEKLQVSQGLPKAEPNLNNLFGYGYQPPPNYMHLDPSKVKQEVKSSSAPSLVLTKSSAADRDMGLLPNPPPLMPDSKSSVIVKNEGQKAGMEKSTLRVSEGHHYLPQASTGNTQLKYEYRSPSQSPHQLPPHHYDQAGMSKVHNHNSAAAMMPQRTRQSPLPPHRQSPHPPHRHSPHQHTMPHRQSPHPHPLPPQRQSVTALPHPHASSPDHSQVRYPPAATLVHSKSAVVSSYPPYPVVASSHHYTPPVTTPPKPKVSSPAPPHIYGKPSSGITVGVPICRAQEMRLSPLPLTSTKASLTTSPYQQLQLPQHHPSPSHQSPAQNSTQAPPPAHSSYTTYQQHQGPGQAVVSVRQPPTSPPSRSSPLAAFQTQPLDLGLKEEQDRGSPKKKIINESECLDVNRRLSDEPVLSRVSEPSPLLANAATTITTVVNTAVTDSLDRPRSAGTPSACPCPRPNTPAKQVSGVDSEKSNSPGPPPKTTSYAVHKLKKAWLVRHGQEDSTDDKDVVGSGSCVTLPLSLPKKEVDRTESVSTVNSLHSIGSMAVNSISKKPKAGRKSAKETPLMNGHTPGKSPDVEDSSSSDPDRKSSPTKRIPPKVKRKKGGRKPAAEEPKRKKLSASSTDSDKESVSERDSDGGKKNSGGQNEKPGKEVGKKRGRRPKATQSQQPKNEGGEESRNKKPREEPPPPPQRDPFAKPPVGQLKKSGDSFLQDGTCFEVAAKLAKCRECRWTPHQRSRNMPNIFCRFYAFRRLRYTKNGQLAIAGFSDPHEDAAQDDLKLWLPMVDSPPADLDRDMSKFLLQQVGDQFCDLLEQEKEAVTIHMSEEKKIAWKRVVQGVREMCDVCETTLFNFHWACGKCGFVVCIDCYKSRKNGTIKMWGSPGRDRDDKWWLLCTNRQGHEQEKLMLTQIIAGDSLAVLGRRVHDTRAAHSIPMYCGCSQATAKPTNGVCKDLLKNLKTETINGQIKANKDDKTEEKNSPLTWLANVALSKEDKKDGGICSDSDEEKDGSYSTLRELLIRPAAKSNGSRAPSPNAVLPPKRPHTDKLDDAITSAIEFSSANDDSPMEVKVETPKLKHFIRRYNGTRKSWRDPLPIRIMTLTESETMYPQVPHMWLCEGRLLRLLDPNHSGNYRIFQDQWKRGQPVIVSNVSQNLNRELWHPDAFIRDFGETKNDLINCMTGNTVPNQLMRKFWEGFEHMTKRLKDDKGNAMLLKLKDWPPGEDFAEMLPSRFGDLMKALPMGEYTQRSGRLNLASRLPECFVRPDLGPKMYTAYGSALHPDKGTTNLHLDVSDAVNVMVYVGIAKDTESDNNVKEAFQAIDDACSDLLTRRRVRDKQEVPGALWHIYNARDADKIRDLLNKVALERGARLEPHHDPIHDQSWYLDGKLRDRLYSEYAVEGYAIVQCLGDAIFIPAGAPHQVQNLHNCIKVAEDFVSPENVSHCFHLTQEFRELSDTHTNHEDKLQIKNIIYHAVKDSLAVLSSKDNIAITKQESKDS